MRQTLTKEAAKLLGHGISITLTDDRKASVGAWRDYQSRFITTEELNERAKHAKGIAIICGKISQGIEVVDIDLKYDVSSNLYDRLKALLPSIFDKLTIAKTINGGYHLYYRCQYIEGNQKLARRPATEQETAKNPHIKILVLIETRGEGGYVIAPPSDGYGWIQGDYTTIPTLSPQERDSILSACRSLNEYLEEPIHDTPKGDYGISPIDDFNERGDVLALLKDHGWTVLYERGGKTFLRRPGKDEGQSGDYWHEKRWFSVFTTSTQFEPNKAYSPAAVYCLLECDNDWTKTVKNLLGKGYGKNISQHNRENSIVKYIAYLRNKGYDDDSIIDVLVRERKIKHKEAVRIAEEAIRRLDNSDEFWEEDHKGRLHVNKDRIIDFLTANGFYLMAYDKAGNDVRIVEVHDCIIEESSIEKAKKCVYNYAKEKDSRVAEWIIDKHSLLSDSFLQFLPKIDPQFLTDEREAAFFPFLNGIVKVTKDKTEVLDYGTIDRYIWKSALIQHSIQLVDTFNDSDTMEWNPLTDVFCEFLFLVADKDPKRLLAMMTTIGYLLHKHKDFTKTYAVCLAEETDDEAKGGGTGKGIFVNALSYLNKTEQIDGKNFRHDKSFVWQRVGLDTRILAIQDVRKNVDFEGFYTIITEGITVERKGMHELYIPFDKSPKILFTTNYMISDLSNHARRRLKILPFSSFFSPERTPLDHFGKQLFHDWDAVDWSLFYNFMFACVRSFLINGVLDIAKTDSMRFKSLSSAFGDEFAQWYDDFRNEGPRFISFKDLYAKFLIDTDLNDKEYSKKRFKKAFTHAAKTFGDHVMDINKGPTGGRCIQYKPIHEQSLTDLVE